MTGSWLRDTENRFMVVTPSIAPAGPTCTGHPDPYRSERERGCVGHGLTRGGARAVNMTALAVERADTAHRTAA